MDECFKRHFNLVNMSSILLLALYTHLFVLLETKKRSQFFLTESKFYL